MSIVDLRSDTVTKPTDEMRAAMAQAEVGDDVFGDDPTVNALQERAAALLGKQAALFVPSGTMGNQLGVLVNTPRGHGVVADSLSHTFVYEVGGAATIAGVQIMPIVTERGVIDSETLARAIAPDDVHVAPTASVVLENTHNMQGGVVWPPDVLRATCRLAHQRGLRVHLDGARIFNAAIACGTKASELVGDTDTVTFCLSKGLSCPIGSLFCGTQHDVEHARRWRKMLGGGMRQAGIIAAAGLVALDSMIDRLADDHANARRLGEGLADLRGASCDLSRVQTNIVYFNVPDAKTFVSRCAQKGVLGTARSATSVRFVTHHGIDQRDVETALVVAREVLSA